MGWVLASVHLPTVAHESRYSFQRGVYPPEDFITYVPTLRSVCKELNRLTDRYSVKKYGLNMLGMFLELQGLPNSSIQINAQRQSRPTIRWRLTSKRSCYNWISGWLEGKSQNWLSLSQIGRLENMWSDGSLTYVSSILVLVVLSNDWSYHLGWDLWQALQE